jgi:hypothetical protein
MKKLVFFLLTIPFYVTAQKSDLPFSVTDDSDSEKEENISFGFDMVSGLVLSLLFKLIIFSHIFSIMKASNMDENEKCFAVLW